MTALSFIVPVRNGADHIGSALDSIFGQAPAGTEVVVVDGLSTDGTLDVVRRYGDRVSRVISEADDGLYDAINKGVRASSGGLIKILNSDDELTAGSVDLALSAYRSARQAGEGNGLVIYGGLEVMDDAGRRIKSWRREQRPFYLPRYFPFLHPSWYVSRRVHEVAGFYDTRYRIAGDREFFLRCRQQGVHFVYLDEDLTRFRVGGLSSAYGGRREAFRIHRQYLTLPQALYIECCKMAKLGVKRATGRMISGQHAGAID